MSPKANNQKYPRHKQKYPNNTPYMSLLSERSLRKGSFFAQISLLLRLLYSFQFVYPLLWYRYRMQMLLL